MGLNWDRFDNAVSELWRFFAPALLNFTLVIILFYPVISSLFRLFSGFIYGLLETSYSINEFTKVFGQLNFENALDILDTISQSVSAVTLLAIVIFLIFVFLLDVFTKWVGTQIPITLDVNMEKIICASPAASIFEPNYPANAMATTWRHARHSLDARDALSFYKEKRKFADDAINQTVNNFTYDKAYIAFSILVILSCIYFYSYWYIILYMGLILIFTYLTGRKVISIRDDFAKSIYTDMEVFFYISNDDERKKFGMVNNSDPEWQATDVNIIDEKLTKFQKFLRLYNDYPVQIDLDDSRLLSLFLRKIRK